MRNKKTFIVLLLAIVCGGMAGYLVLGYLQTRMKTAVAGPTTTTPVVVAARDLAVGSVLSPADLKVVEWPSTNVPSGASSDRNAVVGRGVIIPITTDEPLLDAKLASKEAGGGLSIAIPEGMRAVSVKVDEVIGVAGFVLPGTRVDVLVTLNPTNDEAAAVTRAVLQNVRVVASGQTTQKDAEGKPQTVTVITLLVTPDQAEELTLAATEGRIQLALRNSMDVEEVDTKGAKVARLVTGTEAAAPAARPAARRSAPANNGQSVIMYNGSERSVTTF